MKACAYSVPWAQLTLICGQVHQIFAKSLLKEEVLWKERLIILSFCSLIDTHIDSGSAGGRPGPKPKKPQGDYSEFFSKNALPHYEIKFVVKPDKVHLPEVFLGDDAEESEK